MIKKLKRLINPRKIGKVGLALISDLTSWLLILAPVLTVLLVGYFFLRKAASDEMETRKWDNRIKIALISCVGVIVASGLINVIMSYYK